MEITKKTALVAIATLAATYWVQPYRPVIVSGDSMSPTLSDGQIVISEPLNRAPRAGDVVLVEKDGHTIVKRVALGPGDHFMEGYYKLLHRWQMLDTPEERRMVRDGVVPGRWTVVPDDQMYLLGDNAQVSLDSRIFGFVPISSIRGIVRFDGA